MQEKYVHLYCVGHFNQTDTVKIAKKHLEISADRNLSVQKTNLIITYHKNSLGEKTLITSLEDAMQKAVFKAYILNQNKAESLRIEWDFSPKYGKTNFYCKHEGKHVKIGFLPEGISRLNSYKQMMKNSKQSEQGELVLFSDLLAVQQELNTLTQNKVKAIKKKFQARYDYHTKQLARKQKMQDQAQGKVQVM